jgi:hypothetical protein
MLTTEPRPERHGPIRPPGVQIGSAEVELAPGTGLLGWDRSFCSEAPDAVAADAEKLGGTAGIEPRICDSVARGRQLRRDPIGNKVSQSAKQRVQDGAGIVD